METGTADSSSKITGTAEKASLPSNLSDTLDLQKKTVHFTCGKHGAMQVEVFKIFREWSTPACPHCAEERRREQDRIEKERKEREERETKRAALESRLKRSCIPARFQQKDFGNYHPSTPAAVKILGTCKDYAERFPDFASQGTGIIMCGHTGTGKNHLACAIANHIIRRHEKNAVYMQVSEATRMVKETYAKESARTEQQALNWFKSADLLILDEVGVQFGTDAERYIIFEIVNGRYEDMKPTILISNLAHEGLIEYAGARVIDRMKENGGMRLIFDWKSHRGAEKLPTPEIALSA